MKMCSIYDLPGGSDHADLINEMSHIGTPHGESLRAFGEVAVRFYERGGTSKPRRPEAAEEAVVVVQGRGRLVIDETEHPVAFGDVVIMEANETYYALADEIDPFVLLTFVARIS